MAASEPSPEPTAGTPLGHARTVEPGPSQGPPGVEPDKHRTDVTSKDAALRGGSGSSVPSGRTPLPALARAYVQLTKPNIALYVVMLAAACAYVAGSGRPGWLVLVHLAVGVGLTTAGALALNQFLEREVDGRMRRTRTRPIPQARVSPGGALLFAVALMAAGLGHLAYWVGWLPTALTAASAASYNFVYTPLKSRSYAATLAGAFPGAIPALIGWSAVTGGLELGGWVLFAIAWLWQMPHVLGLAWVLREDYRDAGFRMTPPADSAGRVIGLHMILYGATLVPVSLLPTVVGLTGGVYFVAAFALSGWLLWLCVRAFRNMTSASARRVFLGSLAYQPALLLFMLIDTVRL